ncbi:hypothetical protein L6V77_24125 [Myxococcota bacterium]|nr:hypothetical protein [Myxococcota bacterium]
MHENRRSPPDPLRRVTPLPSGPALVAATLAGALGLAACQSETDDPPPADARADTDAGEADQGAPASDLAVTPPMPPPDAEVFVPPMAPPDDLGFNISDAGPADGALPADLGGLVPDVTPLPDGEVIAPMPPPQDAAVPPDAAPPPDMALVPPMPPPPMPPPPPDR